MTSSSHISGRRERATTLFVVGLAFLDCILATSKLPAQQALPEALHGVFEAGVAAEKAGRLDEAEKDFQLVLRQGGNVAFVYNNLGIVYQRRGDHVRAIVQFREAIRLQPRHVPAHYNLGLALQDKHDIDGAIREYRKAVELQSECCQAQFNLGVALQLKGDVNGAIEQYRKVLRSNPDDSSAHLGLGTALERSGDRQRALEQYRMALKLTPQDPQIRANYERLSQQMTPAEARQIRLPR